MERNASENYNSSSFDSFKKHLKTYLLVPTLTATPSSPWLVPAPQILPLQYKYCIVLCINTILQSAVCQHVSKSICSVFNDTITSLKWIVMTVIATLNPSGCSTTCKLTFDSLSITQAEVTKLMSSTPAKSCSLVWITFQRHLKKCNLNCNNT